MNKNMASLVDRYCSHSRTPDEIDFAQKQYERIGLPGCVGSADVVHVRWERCPAAYRALACGKEGFPTVAYEVVVDHFRRILSVTRGFFGSFNDKIIVRFDGFIQAIHDRELYSEVEFKVFNEVEFHGLKCLFVYHFIKVELRLIT